MAGALTAMIAAAFSGVTPDPYFEYTTLLLPGNGTNGAQNNTFLDGSTNNFTITRNGNTTQGTFSPFSQTGWGYYVPEQISNQVNFTTSAGTDFQFAGDFTIEGWLYAANNSGDGSFYVISDNVNYLAFNISISANVFNIYLNNSTPVAITSDIPLATWTHVAMVRSGSGSGNIKLYTNGVLKGSTTNTSTLGYANPVFSRIGGGAAGINRYYSNLRICKSAVYTGAFTPSTIPLTTTSQGATNCVLLTANSNRFLNQAVGATATITGSPSVVAFSPFNPTASWSAATYGGSGYFDGNGDYLSLTDQAAYDFGAGDFSIDFWYYPISAQQYASVYNRDGVDYPLNIYSGTSTSPAWPECVLAAGTASSWFVTNLATSGVRQNSWNHVAFTRVGSTWRAFTNGVLSTVVTASGTIASGGIPWIGKNGTAAGLSELSMYLSGFRMVKGGIPSLFSTSSTTTGTSIFTPPSQPVTNSESLTAGSLSLLLNFTNAGIYDATSKNDLETVGNAQISTAISAKWGSGSMYFDGTGDYLNTLSTWAISGSEAYTLEAWIYPTTVSGDLCIYETRSSSGTGFVLFINSTGKLQVYDSTGLLQTASTTTLTANTWTYIAMVRSAGSSTNTFYVNGTSAGTFTLASFAAATNARIGARNDGVAAYNGYMQDFRITKGYARTITASPTAAFPTL